MEQAIHTVRVRTVRDDQTQSGSTRDPHLACQNRLRDDQTQSGSTRDPHVRKPVQHFIS